VFESPTLARGSKQTVEAAEFRGGHPALEFLRELTEEDQVKLQALFNWLGANGEIKNRQKFKKVDSDIWEFKSYQIRMLCFFVPGRRVIVTHGFIKKQDGIPPREIKRAKSIRDEWRKKR